MVVYLKKKKNEFLGEPPESEEEYKSRMRRIRIVKFLVGILALYLISKMIQKVRSLFRPQQKRLTASLPQNKLESVFHATFSRQPTALDQIF